MTFDQFMDRLSSGHPKIELAWEVLPAIDGSGAHLADADPDAFVEEYPVSLCGKALQVKDGVLDDLEVCDVCTEISRERQREFDTRVDGEDEVVL